MLLKDFSSTQGAIYGFFDAISVCFQRALYFWPEKVNERGRGGVEKCKIYYVGHTMFNSPTVNIISTFIFIIIFFQKLSYNLLICTFIFTLTFKTMFTVFQKLLKLYSFSLSLSEHLLLPGLTFPLLRQPLQALLTFTFIFTFIVNSTQFNFHSHFHFSEHPLLCGFSFSLLRQSLQALLLLLCKPF